MKQSAARATICSFVLGAGLLFPLAVFGSEAAPPTVTRALTPQDAFETVRLMDDPISISPSGERYVVRLIRGDVARNGVWLELLSGSLTSLSAATDPEIVARLFTSGLGDSNSIIGSDSDTSPKLNPIRWIDDERIAFLWSDRQGIRQIMSVDIKTHQIRSLTNSPSNIVGFDISSNGRIVYNATVPNARTRPQALIHAGFTVGERSDGMALLKGIYDGSSFLDTFWNTEWFTSLDGQSAQRIAIGGVSVDRMLPYGRTLALSPSGQFAVVSGTPKDIPSAWTEYTAPFYKHMVELMRVNPEDQDARRAIQPYLVDIDHGTSRPLWRAMIPMNASASWSPNGQYVVLAPTFLPVDEADAQGLAGHAAVVIDAATGSQARLPISLAGVTVVSVRWLASSVIAIDARETSRASVKQHVFVRKNGSWRQIADAAASGLGQKAHVQVVRREDLNTPTKLYVVDRAVGTERVVWDLNPKLATDYRLGRVEKIEGLLQTGQKWEALVFHPVGYASTERYPLVIQVTSGGIDSGEFTLHGWQNGTGLGPPPIAPYAAQVLANRGMVVAYLSVSMKGGKNEGATYQNAFEVVAHQLVASGLVDSQKVGLNGFSRTGFYVEYALTHSSFPFAAAVVSDNFDSSYIQAALVNWSGAASDTNGDVPFGAGLRAWLDQAPGFNADRVNTPLSLIGQSLGSLPSILSHWEMFSRLRHLKRPVELYVMPDIDRHGSHTSQNPRQVLAVQERVVDWFDFWLNSHEDANARKAEQYAGWRNLRELHEANRRVRP